jgi:hypothetical protein
MDLATNKLLNLTLVQVTDAGNSSVRMEGLGYIQNMDSMLSNGLKIGISVTDRHVQIRKIHREKYLPKKIVHEFDVYHLANSIRKKLMQLAKKKRFSDLSPWIKSVTNHLWWCAASCKGNANELEEKWRSIAQHITNVHSFRKNKIYKKCEHGTIPQNVVKKWLTPDSPAYIAFCDVVTSTKFVILECSSHFILSFSSTLQSG